jgi:hypothetical protein
VLLFPGALPVALDTHNLDLGALQVVHLNGGVPRDIQARPSPTGQRQVSDAVRAAVQACLSGKTSGGCPPPADQRVVPGSVRGRITGNVEKQLTPSIAPGSRSGLLQIFGTLTVEGSYQQLDFDNQPVRKTGSVKLNISAQCNATNPAKLVWVATP